MELLDPLLHADVLGRPAWLWLAFLAIVVALLAFDLGILHRGDRAMSMRATVEEFLEKHGRPAARDGEAR